MMAIFDRNCSKLSKTVSILSIKISPSTSAIRNKDPINEDFPAYHLKKINKILEII
jgi:hypothetical protein